MSGLALGLMLWLTTAQAPAEMSRARAADLRVTSIASEPAGGVRNLDRVDPDVTSPDGQRVARVTPTGRGPESSRSRLIIDGPGRRRVIIAEVVNHFGTAWSPDGTKIAYCSGAILHVADSDGRSRQVLRKGNGGVYPGACFDLAWLADGQSLTFTEVDNASQPDLSTPRRVTLALGTKRGR